VGFVAHGHEHAEREGIFFEDYRSGSVWKPEFFVGLGQAYHGYFHFQRVQDAAGGVDLAQASVHHDQVGQFGFLVEEPRIATADRFAQGLEIVDGAVQAADLEGAVVFLVGNRVQERDKRRHRVLAFQMGDVETLDARRDMFQRECGAQGFKGFRVA